jgi:hypothetical protein
MVCPWKYKGQSHNEPQLTRQHRERLLDPG